MILHKRYIVKVFGGVAEAGVFRGEFAADINSAFPDRKLYLFDSFEGFSKSDLEGEQQYHSLDGTAGNHFTETSIELVMSKMKQKDMVEIRKGYIPDTFRGLENERFCFVNLDMDLYKPTKAALEFFWPRMIPGGGILIHDYSDDSIYAKLKQAVQEFADKEGIPILPIGDTLSVFLPK